MGATALPAMRLLWLGFLYCYLSCRMILCAVTHVAFPIWECVRYMFVPMVLLALELVGVAGVVGIPPGLSDCVLVAYQLYILMFFLITASREVAEFLSIPIFRL